MFSWFNLVELGLSQITSMWDKVTAGINYAGGNVGIGTATPSGKLTVDTGHISLTDEYGLGWGGAVPTNGIKGSASANYVAIKTNGTEKVRVIADGKVGIGTTTPTAKLDVVGNIVASLPTANEHVATKAYVDAAVGASEVVSASGTSNSTNSYGVVFSDRAFSNGGDPNYCLKVDVNGTGVAVNNGNTCARHDDGSVSFCWNGKCLEQDNGGNDICRSYNFLTNTYSNTNEDQLCNKSENSYCKAGNCAKAITYDGKFKPSGDISCPYNLEYSSEPTKLIYYCQVRANQDGLTSEGYIPNSVKIVNNTTTNKGCFYYGYEGRWIYHENGQLVSSITCKIK